MRWRLIGLAAIAVAISACDLATTLLPGPRPVGLNGFIEFRSQAAPTGVEPEPALAAARAAADGIDREFAVDITRRPDVLQYGIATCAEEPACLGADVGASPWAVWLVTWQPDARASWISLLLDPTTGESIWMGAG